MEDAGLSSFGLEDGGHLLLHFAGLLTSYFSEALGAVGIDDGTAAVDDEAAVVVPPVLADIL